MNILQEKFNVIDSTLSLYSLNQNLLESVATALVNITKRFFIIPKNYILSCHKKERRIQQEFNSALYCLMNHELKMPSVINCTNNRFATNLFERQIRRSFISQRHILKKSWFMVKFLNWIALSFLFKIL